MLSVERRDPREDAPWDAFVAGHPNGHLLQSSAWGRFRADWGWEVSRFVVRNADGQVVAGAQALLRSTPLGRVTYVPRGPVCSVADPAWPLLAGALDEEAKPGLALRIEPNWAHRDAARHWLVAEGFVEADAIQPQSTVVVDLGKTEEELLNRMKQKWRYNVRLARRRGVEVSEAGLAGVEDFAALMVQTAERDGFGARPGAYYADAMRAFGQSAHLYLAHREGALLAAILVFHFGDAATYLYGASADTGRRHMPNHLLQWEAMRRAKAEGLRHYDFWGIPDELGLAAMAGDSLEAVPAGQGGLWGVWGFKRGFGGTVCRSVGAWDRVYAPRRYRFGKAAAECKRRLVSLR